jgi:hypothetical protein
VVRLRYPLCGGQAPRNAPHKIETIQHQMKMPINEIKNIFYILTLFSNNMEILNEKYILLHSNKISVENLLLEINKTFTDIYKTIKDIEYYFRQYFINENRPLTINEVIYNLTDSKKTIFLPKIIIDKLFLYKVIINDEIFGNEKMLGIFYPEFKKQVQRKSDKVF